MKKGTVYIWLVTACIILVNGLHLAKAQSFKEILTGLQKEYANIESIHIKMSIQVYENDTSKDPYFKEVADIKRQAQNCSYQFGAVFMLMNSKCLVMVDKSSREIVYTKRSTADEQALYNDPFKLNLDSILLLYENPQYIGKETEGEHYRIFQQRGTIRQIDIFMDLNENRLTRIEYRYEDGHYVVIRFTTFDKNPVFEGNTFSESSYVIEEQGRLKAARAFFGYNVATVDANE